MLNAPTLQQLVSDSHFALINGQNDVALKLAKKALKLDSKSPDAHQCAADANMSLESYNDAITHYKDAVKYDPNNGNRYYDLGFAFATTERLVDALKYFEKAKSLNNCTPEKIAQLHLLLGMVCFEIGRLKDSLSHLVDAEKLIGIDKEIFQRKAIIYGMLEDNQKALSMANQIKLIARTEYLGYQLAFKILCQSNRLETAEKELEKARKYAGLSMDYFEDCVTLEFEKYQKDNDKTHYTKALKLIDESLKVLKPNIQQVVESYINAAEICLQLEDSDRVIECLNAAQNPAESFNSGFEIVQIEYQQKDELTDWEREDQLVTDRQEIAEKLGDFGFEELAESNEPDEEGAREWFTEIEPEEPIEQSEYKLSPEKQVEYTEELTDQINRLYVGAYTLKRDFNNVIVYAKLLQASSNIHSVYVGKYAEVNAMKENGSSDFEAKYEELIKYFRSAMIKNPSDILAVTFRVQCYLDLGNYSEAEQVCNLLPKEARTALLEKITQHYIEVKNFPEAERICELLTDDVKKSLLERISKERDGG